MDRNVTSAGTLTPRPYQVRRIWNECRNTASLELIPPECDAPTSFLPGQFNMLYVFGVGEAPISISGDPTQPQTLIHTVRNVGAVTAAITSQRAGEFLGVRGPFGTHWPVEEAEECDVVLVAGGLGFAPLRPIVYQLLARRERYGRISILYGARTPDDLLYADELQHWRSRFDLEVEITVSRPSIDWRGNVGVVTPLLARAPFDPARTFAMICGPEIMMRFVAKDFELHEVPDDRIYISLERNMKCAIGHCGRCQLGPAFICKDGPIFRLDQIEPYLITREL